MIKNTIEEGKVIEKKSRKKWFLLIFSSLIISIASFYLALHYGLISKFDDALFKTESKKSKLASERKPTLVVDYKNDITKINNLLNELQTENQNLKNRLDLLAQKFEKRSLTSANNSNISLANSMRPEQLNTFLRPLIYQIKNQLESKKNLNTLDLNLEQLQFGLEASGLALESSLLESVIGLRADLHRVFLLLVNKIDALLLTINDNLWDKVNKKFSSQLLSPETIDLELAKTLKESTEGSEMSLQKIIKNEILKFVKVEPMQNYNRTNSPDLEVFKSMIEISTAIAASRIYLSQLEFGKLEDLLNDIDEDIVNNFTETQVSKKIIDDILQTIDDTEFEDNALDTILDHIDNENLEK